MIVLDSHVWLWWINDDRKLSSSARAAIDTETEVRVCAISAYELATAARRKRLELDPTPEQWIADATRPRSFKVAPVTAELCVAAALLDWMHGDPADRLIVALARELDAKLVTADGKILAYPHVRTIRAD